MPALVGYLLLFVVVGVGFIFVHLLAGKLIRPANPEGEKLTIYECGEPTIGSAWVQFDLRFYVVALLFVIFDVEVAFFFPWAVVFGRTNKLARDDLPVAERAALVKELAPYARTGQEDALVVALQRKEVLVRERDELKKSGRVELAPRLGELDKEIARLTEEATAKTAAVREAANRFGWLAFIDILVFFGILLVGFAYLWKRGDLEWVRSVASEQQAVRAPPPPPPLQREPLVVVETSSH